MGGVLRKTGEAENMNRYSLLRIVAGGILALFWATRAAFVAKGLVTREEFLISTLIVFVLLGLIYSSIAKQKGTWNPNVVKNEFWKDILIIILLNVIGIFAQPLIEEFFG